MQAPVSRTVVEAFYAAFASRDPARIAPFIHHDAEWMIVGPIDLLRFCGHRQGKTAIMELYQRVIPHVLHVTGFEIEILLVDQDRAATLNRVIGVQHETGRRISYRCSQFLRFRDEKVIELRSVIDSFDAAEQLLGHPIELTPDTTAALA